eukprot:CAMPEP_0168217640 /NCGR_PEP_ID=MMETSP0140_2-20121125/7381_1 /TAXON_ID=44445 /ORGANISM="Pseudo-nitzschia australis, Strain 10249 10 AB" /LENGTH=120 /DNA_ID=CAMNT_0008145461 /DNA_START=83 /DNA_END=445 /DNA_ORIENTATION=-
MALLLGAHFLMVPFPLLLCYTYNVPNENAPYRAVSVLVDPTMMDHLSVGVITAIIAETNLPEVKGMTTGDVVEAADSTMEAVTTDAEVDIIEAVGVTTVVEVTTTVEAVTIDSTKEVAEV